MAGAALLVIAVAVGFAHRPSAGQRSTDLGAFLREVTGDIQSCAGGVQESLYLLQVISTGASHNLSMAVSEASYGASNCSPANNELLGNLTSYQVPESLSSYRLQTAVTAMINWAAPDAERVQSDVVTALRELGKPAEATALAALRGALRRLNAQRAAIYSMLRPAIRALAPRSALPVLPG